MVGHGPIYRYLQFCTACKSNGIDVVYSEDDKRNLSISWSATWGIWAKIEVDVVKYYSDHKRKTQKQFRYKIINIFEMN